MHNNTTTNPIRIISTTLAGPGTAPIIGDALRSVAPLVDECVVIWTGEEETRGDDVWNASVRGLRSVASPDDVALNWQAWPWRDHFGEARNAALDFAGETGADWAVMVDTDERIVCPVPAAVRAYLAALPPDVVVVIAQATDGSHGRERFFRLPAKHRWQGRTHEAFPVPHGAQAIILPTLITWDELPKTPEQLRAKNERDVEMLEREITEHPDEVSWRLYLGRALAGLGRWDEAIDALRAAADCGAGEYPAIACFHAAEICVNAAKWDEAIAAAARGMIHYPAMAELPWIAGVASLFAGRPDHAEAWARIAAVHAEGGPGADALARRVAFRSRRGVTVGPGEVLRGALAAQANEAPTFAPDEKPVHITVTSTGFRVDIGDASRCLSSVREQRHRAHHAYVAADEMTLSSAACSANGVVVGIGRGLLENLLPIWRALPDDEVIVWLDGDDWLATDRALEHVAAAHQAGAWVTYGSFIDSGGRMGFAAPVYGEPRRAPWTASHLKTFRAGLVKRIRDEHLRDASGAYLTVGIDQAIMLPLLEMAGPRAKFIPEILAVYNIGHSFEANASPADIERERREVLRIRSLAPYARVESLTAES